jgi:hypothetical protein
LGGLDVEELRVDVSYQEPYGVLVLRLGRPLGSRGVENPGVSLEHGVGRVRDGGIFVCLIIVAALGVNAVRSPVLPGRRSKLTTCRGNLRFGRPG